MNTLVIMNSGGGDIGVYVLNDALSQEVMKIRDLAIKEKLSNWEYQEAICSLIYNDEKYGSQRNPEVPGVSVQSLVLEKCPMNLNFDQVVYFHDF